ncbi:hypothetical protein [Mesorhizobium sp.]|uniref:hypothetical protein n=1 Tax=Mesorhizobium sp. TaxID=1871066 RepID=UPI0026971C91
MRSFKLPLTFKLPRTAALAALVVAVPFAGAYAASAGFYTPRTAGLIDQAQSVDQGITAARQMDKIKPAEARDLHRQASASAGSRNGKPRRDMARYHPSNISSWWRSSMM